MQDRKNTLICTDPSADSGIDRRGIPDCVACAGKSLARCATGGNALARVLGRGVKFDRRLKLLCSALGAMLTLCGTAAKAQSPGASANLAATGSDAYSITLSNTGTTTIGTFWYAWTPGQDYMSVEPTNITSPAGWKDLITGSGNSTDGYAIQWTATSSTSYLAAGNSLSGFSFDSTLPAVQLTADDSPFYPSTPVGTSVAYSGGPFSSAGDTFVVNTVPEPSTFVLAAAAAGVWLMGRGRRRFF